ncbi:hypothetical protein NEA10_13145 [Phormidium yuhuli AB48]|uniref:Uncharacterized protein n=1 Tax=Phormidium yuhuli AB48 TaxID=2940671 RepID=A0ABY5ANR6_9CYAN|nr:hypothetical protein [Phormidium yuhuli]USR89808.1 hypothetical protein NEA10_13145 [Phormidium yuhuli AB48]
MSSVPAPSWDTLETVARSTEVDRPMYNRSHSKGIIATVERRDRLSGEGRVQEFPPSVRLDFEGLTRFEVVSDQYKRWGVEFDNAIAVSPSNPAYPTHSGEMVLMAAPKSGFLELTFDRPVQFVAGYVTSSRFTAMSAYNDGGQTITRAELPGANLANSNSSVQPNQQLIVRSPNIRRVTFYAFDGELVVDDISFGY